MSDSLSSTVEASVKQEKKEDNEGVRLFFSNGWLLLIWSRYKQRTTTTKRLHGTKKAGGKRHSLEQVPLQNLLEN